MGSPEFLDFDRLLQPISDDNPTGDSFRAIDGMAYQDLRKLRDESRKNENRMVFPDDGTDQSHQPEWSAEPEWNLVFDRCEAGLRDTSKDLQLTAWLIEAAIRLEGFRGLRDGLRLVRLLCERYWDDLNPMPDEDGMETRVAPLAGLNGEDTDGPLVTAIRNVPITNSETLDPGTVWQIETPEHRDAVLRAVADSTPDFLRTLLEDIEESQDEFRQLEAFLDANCGEDSSGYPSAPPASRIREALDTARMIVAGFGSDTETAAEEAEEAAGTASGAMSAAGIASRAQAFKNLAEIARYFRTAEPHSPVSYALDQIVSWGKMSLPDLLTQLIRDSSAREELFRQVGIPEPRDDE